MCSKSHWDGTNILKSWSCIIRNIEINLFDFVAGYNKWTKGKTIFETSFVWRLTRPIRALEHNMKQFLHNYIATTYLFNYSWGHSLEKNIKILKTSQLSWADVRNWRRQTRKQIFYRYLQKNSNLHISATFLFHIPSENIGMNHRHYIGT